jgi:TonB family protein
LSVGNKICQSHFVEPGQSGERLLQTTAMSGPTKQPVNALDRSTQRSATRSIVQSAETSASQAHPVPAEIPIGVLEVPVGVWGSRRVVPTPGQPGGIDVFAEETCTVIVFPHGAVIRLSAAVHPGQMMMVANRKSSQAVPCRVVNIRNYPNVRGFAEIEFMRSQNDFWGPYISQGTSILTARIPSVAPEKAPMPAPDARRPASTEARILAPSAPFQEPPAAVSTPSEDFWSSSFPEEVISVLANPTTASPAPPLTVRNKVEASERSARSWIRGLLSPSLGQLIARASTGRTPSPRRRTAFVWVTATCLLMMSATGIFFLHRGAAQSAETTETDAAPVASVVLPEANTMRSSQLESDPRPTGPELPIIAKTENFPGTQARELADNVRIPQPPVRMPSLERKIPKGNLHSLPLVARRSAAAITRDVPPDLTGVDSNTSAGAIQGVLPALLPPGGQVKEPRLVFRSVPSYPAMAKRAGIEGQVTIDAVIDTTGELTSMKVVSGAPELQQAALDSLRAWKYEPGYLDNKPVPVKTSITVKFRLH